MDICALVAAEFVYIPDYLNYLKRKEKKSKIVLLHFRAILFINKPVTNAQISKKLNLKI